jgi:hypothetical protein
VTLSQQATQESSSKMPAKSEKQYRAMQAAAHGKSTLGIPKSVGEEFVHGKDKAPKKKHHSPDEYPTGPAKQGDSGIDGPINYPPSDKTKKQTKWGPKHVTAN